MTKTNTRSRIVSILLVLVMLLTMVPITGVTASAGEMLPPLEVGTYKELRSAILRGKSRIKLKNDINTRDVYASGVGIPEDEMITIGYDEDITLDLNGYTLALETLVRGGFSFFTVYGELEIKDSSPSQTGKITGKFPARLASMFRTGGGTLTLQSGTLMTYSNKNDVITVGSSGGHVVINGGRICSGIWDTSSTSPCGYAVLAVTGFVDVEEMEVIINGGVFDGAVGFFPLSEFTCEKPRFHIYGGTFKKDVLLRCGQKTFKTHSPILEICGGSFEGGLKIYDWGMDLVGNTAQSYPPFKLLGGTFSCTMDLCYEKSSWGFISPNLDQIIDAPKYERVRPVFAAMFENSAIVKPSGTYTADDIGKGMDWAEREGYGGYYQMLLKGTAANPVRIIPNAWGVMESVTLDGDEINYAKDWNGTAVVIKNNEDHTITFKWKDLEDELKTAGYRYDAKCMRYTSGDTTGLIPTDQIPTGTEYYFTIREGTDPKVYSFDLRLDLKKNGVDLSSFTNQHIVRLVVCEAPPAPVAHSITVTNGRGTANPTSAMAGETVTVKAKDDTANNMMFTRWYTDTPGVTFADATTQETTFVMPDCDVKVNPGFQQVSFTKQPIDSWPQVNHGSKAIVTFSAPITKWELKEGNTTVASSGSLFINTGNPITVDIPAQSSAVEKTYTVVVTANDQKFSSNEFKVSWINWPKAPEVEFTPADGTQFVGEIEVIAFDALYAGEEIFEIAYTTDGTDPKTSTTTIYANTDTEHITLKETTTIKARACNYDAAADDEKWGPLATAAFTKYSDSTLPKPTITPEGTTYTGSITAYLTAPALDGVKMEYCLMQTGDPNTIGSWATYDPETGITVNEFGTITLYARTFKEVEAETPDGLYYVETLTSENASATYTRTYSAAIDNVTVSGKVGKTMTQDVVIRMNGDRFENVTAGDDVSTWFNLPAGLTAKVKEQTSYSRELVITISGMPTATSAAVITVTIPKDKLYANNTTDLTVLSNPNAYYSIALDADHQHDYSGQPYLYLDPGNHYQECTAGDGYNIQAHEFTAWTDNGNGTHSHHCTVCKMADGSTYTETAEHTWVWVVDQEAALNQPGKQHEECTGCHAKRSENTEIPAPRDYAVTVTGGTATVATGTSITRAMEGVEVTVTAQAPDGKHFVKWVVKAGGVTLANETSATTTFTMPGNDVKIEATYKDAPPSDTPPSDTPSYGVYVGMTYTAGNLIYQITSIDTATLGQSKVIGVVAAKKNKIKKVTIPDRADCKGYRLNVTAIGNNAFAGCKALKKLTIGNKVTVIGKNAFKKCSKLETVVIGKAVKTISSKAFIGDNKIKKITFKGKKLKTVNKNAFSKKAKKNIKSKKTKLKGNKKAIKLFKKKLKIK